MVFMAPTTPDLRLVSSNPNHNSCEKVGAPSVVFGTDLLSEEDLVEIDRYGVPCGLREDLASLSSAGLRFTQKGWQYYVHSLRTHGVDQDLKSVTDEPSLTELHANIFAAVRHKVRSDLYDEYQAGRIAPQEKEVVEARLFGGLGDILRALKRSALFGKAGANIIPVVFKEKRRS